MIVFVAVNLLFFIFSRTSFQKIVLNIKSKLNRIQLCEPLFIKTSSDTVNKKETNNNQTKIILLLQK